MTAAIVALALSTLLLGTAITLLVMLRRGDGPLYSASRFYDANRREEVRLLLGSEVATPPLDQWFVAGHREPIRDATLEKELCDVTAEALRAVVPADRGLVVESNGRVRLEGAQIVAALSTADLRSSSAIEAWDERGLIIGLVLLNPEPPGGDARRVTLPVQVLFPALERARREDLIRRFGELRYRAAAPMIMEVSS